MAPRDLWPAWLNEGMAEYFERQALGRTTSTRTRTRACAAAVASGEWIPLAELSGPTLAGLGQAQAELAYLESYAAVEMMFRRAGRRPREVARARGGTDTFARRALQSAMRVELAGLEAQLVAELR